MRHPHLHAICFDFSALLPPPLGSTFSRHRNSDLHVTSITYPAGFSGAFSGTIAAGGSAEVMVRFAPTAATSYGGNVTVNADQTGGIETQSASGAGNISTASLVRIVNISTQGCRVSVQTVAGKSYRLDWSSDLVTWNLLTTFTSSGAAVEFLDEAAKQQGKRFYRVVEQ